MVKTLKFGEKEVRFSTSFAWAFVFKNQFHQDPAKLLIPTIVKMDTQTSEDGEQVSDEQQAMVLYEELGFTGIVQIAWSMAKLCDRNIPEPIEWVLSFGEDFGALDLVLELMPEAIESCFSTKNSMAPNLTKELEEEQKKANEK